jgi:hypothetical protein
MRLKYLRFIVRYDGKYGYFWKFHIQRKDGYFSKMFSDCIYGSKEKSLKAAIVFRDDYLSKKKPRLMEEHSRNESGIIGVSRHFCERHGNFYENFHAHWQENGRRVIRKFSTRKYGEKRALELAVRARREGEERMLQAAQHRQKEWLKKVKTSVQPGKSTSCAPHV